MLDDVPERKCTQNNNECTNTVFICAACEGLADEVACSSCWIHNMQEKCWFCRQRKARQENPYGRFCMHCHGQQQDVHTSSCSRCYYCHLALPEDAKSLSDAERRCNYKSDNVDDDCKRPLLVCDSCVKMHEPTVICDRCYARTWPHGAMSCFKCRDKYTATRCGRFCQSCYHTYLMTAAQNVLETKPGPLKTR